MLQKSLRLRFARPYSITNLTIYSNANTAQAKEKQSEILRQALRKSPNDFRLHIKNAYIIPDRKSIFPGASRKDMKSEASGACGGGTEPTVTQTPIVLCNG